MAYVISEPNKVYVEDVQFSTSVSEAVGNKLGSSLNYVLDNFDAYSFGVTGSPYSALSIYPYAFSGTTENIRANCAITDIHIYNEVCGISGSTEFRIERQLSSGGAWTNIFSTNCVISNTANDGVSFNMNDLTAPSGVTFPVASIQDFLANEKLRFVLVSAANQAQNLLIKLVMRPV